jgi:hypothetical protein
VRDGTRRECPETIRANRCLCGARHNPRNLEIVSSQRAACSVSAMGVGGCAHCTLTAEINQRASAATTKILR